MFNVHTSVTWLLTTWYRKHYPATIKLNMKLQFSWIKAFWSQGWVGVQSESYYCFNHNTQSVLHSWSNPTVLQIIGGFCHRLNTTEVSRIRFAVFAVLKITFDKCNSGCLPRISVLVTLNHCGHFILELSFTKDRVLVTILIDILQQKTLWRHIQTFIDSQSPGKTYINKHIWG